MVPKKGHKRHSKFISTVTQNLLSLTSQEIASIKTALTGVIKSSFSMLTALTGGCYFGTEQHN